jgi:excisionase family DNA binding protein
MSATDLERIEAELKALRALLVGERRVVERYMYSPREAATALGIGKSKFWRLVKSGELMMRPLGKERMVPVSELRRYGEVEYHRANPKRPARSAPRARVGPLDGSKLKAFFKRKPKGT